MKTITVIPKLVATHNGQEYSAYGSILPGSVLERKDKYTWLLNDNGRLTVGLGRQPVDKEEAIKIALDMEKLGYKYEGVEE
jgi:hypothetical protein